MNVIMTHLRKGRISSRPFELGEQWLCFGCVDNMRHVEVFFAFLVFVKQRTILDLGRIDITKVTYVHST